MLSFQSVTLRRGPRILLQNITLTIQSGEHWGIVGRNGSGKSSFLALILGTRDTSGLHPDQGEVQLSTNLALAHVAVKDRVEVAEPGRVDCHLGRPRLL